MCSQEKKVKIAESPIEILFINPFLKTIVVSRCKSIFVAFYYEEEENRFPFSLSNYT